MSDVDTSAEAVERLAKRLRMWMPDTPAGAEHHEAADALERLVAERDAWQNTAQIMGRQRNEALDRAEKAEADLTAYAGPPELRPDVVLAAERDRLAAEGAVWRRRTQEAEVENAQLREALRPFAALADEIEHAARGYRHTQPESDPAAWAKACGWDDLCAARAALTGERSDDQ